MKKLLLFTFSILIISSCCKKQHCDDVYSTSNTQDQYVCGKIAVPNKGSQLGIIVVSQTHDNSYKVFYDKDSFDDQNMVVKKRDEICFKLENIRGVSFAKSITKEADLNETQIYDGKFSSSLFVHAELQHDYSKDAHKKTHIYIKQNIVTGENIYYAFKDDSDNFNSSVDLSLMDEVLIPNVYKQRIDASTNRVYYSNWSNPIILNGRTIITLDELSKCHSHGATKKICIEN